MDASFFQPAVAYRLPRRTRWRVQGIPEDYLFYSAPCSVAAMLDGTGSEASLANAQEFLAFGELDYNEGGGAQMWLAVRQTDGKVFSVEMEREPPAMLLNSSFAAFVNTFCLLDKYLGQGQPTPADLDAAVRELDPTAYAESEWRGLVAEATAG